MKIGLDFDGVISDCGQLKSDGARTLYGINIPPHLFKKEIVVGGGHLTFEQYRHLQKSIYHERELGLLMKPVVGIQTFLNMLLELGHEILVVTSRETEALDVAQEWSNINGLVLNFVGVGYGKSKADAAVGLDVYVDDDLDKLEPLVGIVPNLYLLSWGYNEHINEEGIARRVYSLEELSQLIADLGASQ